MDSPSKKVLVVAGEASGDAMAASVIRALGPDWRASGIGGCACADTGMACLHRAEELSLVGISEVLGSVPRVAKIAVDLVLGALLFRPDVILLVDLPEVNLRLGPLLKRLLRTPIVYMAAPQAWGWRPWRARSMASWVDHLACVYPFEPPFFAAHGVRASFVGHPRAVAARAVRRVAESTSSRDLIAVLPGSRSSELHHHSPVLQEVIPRLAETYPSLQLVVPVAPTLRASDVAHALGESAKLVECRSGDSLEVLSRSVLAITASGTAATECMLCGAVPVVFYRVSWLTYAIASRLVRVPFIAMPNLLAGNALVPELVQDEFTADNIVFEVNALMNPSRLASIRNELEILGKRMMGPIEEDVEPSDRVAQIIVNLVTNTDESSRLSFSRLSHPN